MSDIKDAIDAMVNLNQFAAIQAMTENGLLRGNVPAARKISDICKKEIQRQLKIHDKAMGRTNQ